MKNQFVNLLDDKKFKFLLKVLDYPTYETGFKQGTKRLEMTDGSIGMFSYNCSGERILYIKDFKVKHSTKRKLPHELPIDRKRTEALFVFMMQEFEDYYNRAKEYWKEDKFLLRILNRAYRKLQLKKDEEENDNA